MYRRGFLRTLISTVAAVKVTKSDKVDITPVAITHAGRVEAYPMPSTLTVCSSTDTWGLAGKVIRFPEYPIFPILKWHEEDEDLDS